MAEPLRAPPPSRDLRRRNAALLASARRIEVKNPDDLMWLKRQRQEWQTSAWQYNDTLGEINFAHRYKANMLSRVNIFPAWRADPNADPVPMDPDDVPDNAPPDYKELAVNAKVELERLAGPAGTYGPILAPMAWNLALVGECYLVGLPDEDDPDGELFDVLSIDELKIADASRGEVSVRAYPGDNEGMPLDPNTFFLRVWRRHPRWRNLADAPMSALLDVCEELALLGRAIMASARSRLNAGILGLPQEMLFTDGLDLPDDGGQTRRDPFMADLEEAMTQPLLDPGHPSTLVPLLLRAPAEYLEKIRHLLLDRPIDAQQLAERQELRVRLATGLDLPAEILLGLADANHWSAWAIDEQTWKAHLEPDMVLILESLTKGFLQPALTAAGFDPRGVIISHDASDLLGDENEFDRAALMHSPEHRVVSHAFLRRKGGASEDDAPTDDELKNWPGGAGPAPPPGAEPGGPPPAQAGPPGDQAQVEKGPPPEPQPAVTAAGRKKPDLQRLAERLTQIDRELRLQVIEKANQAVHHALERAGASLRRRLQGDKKLAFQLRDTPNLQLAAAIGKARVGAWDLTEEQLIEDNIDEFQDWYLARTARAKRAALLAIYREFGEVPEQGALDNYEAESEHNIVESFTHIAEAIHDAAHHHIFSPHPEAPAAGEFDAFSRIPTGIVREALGRAGGNAFAPMATPQPEPEPSYVTMRPFGGIATGEATDDLLRLTFGVTAEGGRWLYGDPASRTRPFEPHYDLDGVTFSDWNDEILRNPFAFPDTEFFFPGDHSTCQCDYIPILQAGE